ncbi:DNA-binding response regulator [Niabella ginsenosidivorans]|uniref:DNA-binding response regulator n=1 Tax=Niabella ginsenosidivorans TaxID=1176587 RepID=A0A1A9I4D8_9BACT|nr:response regulator transcription factor [Niabella ginsenosidivorans]ANH82486.1 DNA-binding response regulator [Niabella ginsenosidivorans]
MSAAKQTIAIVDDHPVVLEGLVKLLNKEKSFAVAGSFATAGGLLQFLQQQFVNIVLLDVALPDGNGMELCREIKALAPQTIVLAFSNYNERGAILKMLQNGASGYILKSAAAEEIIHCMHDALAGRLAFSGEVHRILSVTEPQTSAPQPVSLTAREKEILQMIATGSTTPQIAKTLYLSKFTVENHRKNLLQKLQVKNVAELIAAAAKQGII